MTPDRWQEALDLFDELAELDGPDRAARLAVVSDRDAELASAVTALFAADAEADAVLRPYETAVSLSGTEGLASATVPFPLEDPYGLLGTNVSAYHVEALIGTGGMGVLYRAVDTRLGRPVALKFLPPLLASQPGIRERFLREARAVATLDHPNVCAIYEVGEMREGIPFIAMAFYEGETISQKIEKGPLTEQEALDLATQARRGLSAAHERGIVHRDVKPANLVVTEGGVLKILDFGLAKTDDVTLTTPGLRVGTVAYMSPEQTRGEEVDFRTDLWSLGVVTYEMLTGLRPFRGDTDRSIVQAIRHDEPRRPSELREGLSSDLEAMVLRLLSKEPEQRAEGARVLRAGPEERAGDRARRLERVPGRPRHRTAVVTVAVVALAMVAAWVATAGDREAPALRRLAVLPLENRTGNPERDYLVDGFHEGLVSRLSQLTALLVTSRESVLRYGGGDRPIREVADELGVDAVVLGSVSEVGDLVRVNVHLIRAELETHLWEATWDGRREELLALEGEVAEGLAEAVDVRLAPEERTRLTKAPDVPGSAQDAYVRGVYDLRRLTNQPSYGEMQRAIRSAIANLKDAIAADPNWGAAHAKLALAYHWLASSNPAEAAEYYPKSKAAAVRALALDETEAQAHSSLGFVLAMYERDWVGAERAIRRALALEPNSVNHSIYGIYLLFAGRYEDAIDHYRAAEERDPLSRIRKRQLAGAYACAGRHDEAIAQFENLAAWLGGEDAGLKRGIGYAYSAKGMHREAAEQLEAAVRLSDSTGVFVAGLAYVYARAGRVDEARRWIQWLDDRFEHWGRAAPEALIATGDIDRAIAVIRELRAVNPIYPSVRCLLSRANVAGDPRIQALEAELGNPD